MIYSSDRIISQAPQQKAAGSLLGVKYVYGEYGMKILIIGGTRYFGIPMTKALIRKGHDITIATRGNTKDTYGDSVSRIIFDRSDENSVRAFLRRERYDVIIDKIAYSSNDVRRILDNIECGKYILMSSSSVYENIHSGTKESDFSADKHELKWCERADFNYAEVKRQAECALVHHYPEQEYIAVRYPVVIGKNDYTNRLRFYAESIYNCIPFFVDDMDSRISFIHENEAGLFLSHLADSDITGAVNGCSRGDISIAEIITYIELKTGRKAVLSKYGKPAPYNGYPEFATLDTHRAAETGFHFTNVRDYIFETIDHYINDLNKN